MIIYILVISNYFLDQKLIKIVLLCGFDFTRFSGMKSIT